MNLKNVNKRNTREWALFNGNSRSAQNRQKLIEKYGGTWERQNNEWVWNERVNKIIQFTKPKTKRTIFVFTDKSGIQYITDNFEGFCRERSINSSAMHEVMTGKRKTFKGFTVKRIKPEDQG